MARVSALCVFLLLGSPVVASAGPSVSLRWSGTTGSGTTGSSAISVSNAQPETLTLEIVVDAQYEEIRGLSLSVEYDSDGDDELDQLSRKELSWSNAKASRTLGPLAPGIASSQESTAALPGGAYGFEGVSLAAGPSNLSFSFARIVFVTRPGHIQSDGSDVVSGFLRADGDLAFDEREAPSNSISDLFSFGTASVNAQ